MVRGSSAALVGPSSQMAAHHLRNKGGCDSVRAIIQEGGTLIQGIRTKLAVLEQSKQQLQNKIERFENKMQ